MRRFGKWFRVWFVVVVLALCSGAFCPAQEPAASLKIKLASLAARAGTAFVGQVIAVERQGDTVVTQFRVDQPVIGGAPNGYKLREWAGLWPQGQVRYAVGERVLIFLHGPNGQGLSTPVDGAEGVLPVLVQGLGAMPLVDIRRLGAAILRPVGVALPGTGDGAITLADALGIVHAAIASAPDDMGARGPLTQRPVPEHGVELHAVPTRSLHPNEPAGQQLPSRSTLGRNGLGEVLHAHS